MKDNKRLLCKIGLHKWERHSPKFKDVNHYYSMMFSPYSSTSNFFQFREVCIKCKRERIRLQECFEYGGLARINTITVPRFTIQEGIDFITNLAISTFQKEGHND